MENATENWKRMKEEVNRIRILFSSYFKFIFIMENVKYRM